MSQVLTISFVALSFFVAALIGFLSFQNSQKNVRMLAFRLLEETNLRVEQNLKRYINRPHLVNDINRGNLSSGQIELDDT